MTTIQTEEKLMKIEHKLFDAMLSAKGITKKAFSKYARIPYYTVAGWKKSGKVPAYAMVILRNMSVSKTVTAQKLLDIGMPRAVFWNNNLEKEVPSDIFIVSTLKRAYNDFVIDKFIAFFGEDMVLSSLDRHRQVVSDKLIQSVENHIHTTLASA